MQLAGNADVTMTVKDTTSCDAVPGICTPGGTMLAGGLNTLIAGPAELSVADAEGATLDFVVTLSKCCFSATTVHYATSDGTATAGSDYIQGRLMVDAAHTWRSEHSVHFFDNLVWRAFNGNVYEVG